MVPKQWMVVLPALLLINSCSNDQRREKKAATENGPGSQGPPAPTMNFDIVKTTAKDAVKIKAIVTDDIVYQILEDALLPASSLADSEKIKVLNITSANINRDGALGSLAGFCTAGDSAEFFSVVDTSNYIFDCSRLPNAGCIRAAEAIALFSGRKIDSGWIRFQTIHGKGGLHYFSIPLLNRDKTKALMTIGSQSGRLIGSGNLLLLVKKKGHWRIVKKRLRWVS